jgi:hypothetical protein
MFDCFHGKPSSIWMSLHNPRYAWKDREDILLLDLQNRCCWLQLVPTHKIGAVVKICEGRTSRRFCAEFGSNVSVDIVPRFGLFSILPSSRWMKLLCRPSESESGEARAQAKTTSVFMVRNEVMGWPVATTTCNQIEVCSWFPNRSDM